MLTRCEVGARARQEKIAGASLRCWRAPPGRNSLSLPAPVIPPFSLVLNTNRFLIATQSVAPLHPQLTRLTSPRMRAAVSIFTSQVSPGPFASVAPKSPESLSLHPLLRPTSRSNSPDRPSLPASKPWPSSLKSLLPFCLTSFALQDYISGTIAPLPPAADASTDHQPPCRPPVEGLY